MFHVIPPPQTLIGKLGPASCIGHVPFSVPLGLQSPGQCVPMQRQDELVLCWSVGGVCIRAEARDVVHLEAREEANVLGVVQVVRHDRVLRMTGESYKVLVKRVPPLCCKSRLLVAHGGNGDHTAVERDVQFEVGHRHRLVKGVHREQLRVVAVHAVKLRLHLWQKPECVLEVEHFQFVSRLAVAHLSN